MVTDVSDRYLEEARSFDGVDTTLVDELTRATPTAGTLDEGDVPTDGKPGPGRDEFRSWSYADTGRQCRRLTEHDSENVRSVSRRTSMTSDAIG